MFHSFNFTIIFVCYSVTEKRNFISIGISGGLALFVIFWPDFYSRPITCLTWAADELLNDSISTYVWPILAAQVLTRMRILGSSSEAVPCQHGGCHLIPHILPFSNQALSRCAAVHLLQCRFYLSDQINSYKAHNNLLFRVDQMMGNNNEFVVTSP